MRLLLATTNEGKIREIRQLLSVGEFEIEGLGGRATGEEIETGSTFEENALLKARYYNHLTGLVTISDDSGLEVEALAGAPGIYSARFGGPTDADRIVKLLGELSDVPCEKRRARFVCSAAVAWNGGEKVFTDEARGMILDAPRGTNGFGYDPIFYFEPLGRTFAELSREEKEEVSHRGRAFRRLARWISQPGALDTSRSGDRI